MVTTPGGNNLSMTSLLEKTRVVGVRSPVKNEVRDGLQLTAWQ